MELADQQVSDNAGSGGLTGAEIPSSAADVPAAPAPAEKPDKPLSVREQITKSIETARVEEAKRARAADGKFTKLESGAAEKPATDKPEIPKPETNAQPEASKPVGPPSGWSKEAKAIWDQLPEAVKADAVRREAEVAKGFDEYRSKTAQLQEISQAIEPLRPMLQQHGITSDAQAVKRLLEWEGAIRNPATRIQAIHGLLQQYGVDPSTLVPSSQSGSPSAAQDIPDQLRPVIDQFGNVVQQVQDVASRVQSWEQNQVADKISAFAANNHPHFEAVRVQMGQLMTAGMVQPGDLEGAYQMAIKINPEISAKIAEEERNKAEEAAKVAAAEKARKAQLAAVSPVTRPPVGASPNQPGKKAGVRDSILSSIATLREEQRA